MSVIGKNQVARRRLNDADTLQIPEQDSAGHHLLLADIWGLFDARCADRLSSQDIVTALLATDQRPWAAAKLTKRRLARLLARYRISSRKLRVGESTCNGYLPEMFVEALREPARFR